MTIYLDVIWFLNVCVDGLLLYLTALVLKRPPRWFRLMIGSIVGSSIVLILFSPFSVYGYHPITKLFLSFLMILITFGYSSFKKFCRTLFTFYFVTFGVGGGMLAVHYFLKNDVQVIEGVIQTKFSGYGDPISWSFVCILFPLAWFFSKRRFHHLEWTKVRYDQMIDVSLEFFGQAIRCRGLIDSGNQLYDPITKWPVMILDVEKKESFFPKPLLDAIQIGQIPDADDERIMEWLKRLRIIPCKAVGQDHHMLFALKPDHIYLHQDGQVTQVKALVGLSTTRLSNEDEYECILHPKMMVTIHAS